MEKTKERDKKIDYDESAKKERARLSNYYTIKSQHGTWEEGIKKKIKLLNYQVMQRQAAKKKQDAHSAEQSSKRSTATSL